MSRVAVVGSSILDVAVVTPRFPRPGETVRPDALGLYPGGKGFNQALALARLGHDVLFISRLGDDPLAEIFRTLRAIGFQGYLSLELFNRDYWKQDALSVAKTGLEKMRELVRTALA
ncbi:MAG: PfkB family carbohydrate kinase [bacterium]|nr:PfkB family carbohydrate kinase [bacterium]